MPRCANCGSLVSKQYAMVKAPDSTGVPACPECPDAKIQNGEKYMYRG